MVRRRGTSRVTPVGSGGRSGNRPGSAGPPELPSIRRRRPVLFWGLMVAMIGLILPLFLTLLQALR